MPADDAPFVPAADVIDRVTWVVYMVLAVMKDVPLSQFDGIRLDGLEFCSKVCRLYESIRYGADGPSRMRMRPSRVEKKLLDELMPICKYLQASYGPGDDSLTCAGPTEISSVMPRYFSVVRTWTKFETKPMHFLKLRA